MSSADLAWSGVVATDRQHEDSCEMVFEMPIAKRLSDLDGAGSGWRRID